MERHHRRPLGGARGKYELPEEIGKAYSQLLTFLTEVEMIATDVPAKWLGRLNADFFEVKSLSPRRRWTRRATPRCSASAP